MNSILQIVGPEHTVQLFGIKLLGIDAENGKKLPFTIIFLALALLFSRALKFIARAALGERRGPLHFWVRQTVHMFTSAVIIIGLLSIWFNDPGRLASAAALVTAGLAIASQRMITAFAGYFIILRGKNFSVGDRIVMGGVRGDVISLDFMQTTILEMGQPPPEQGDAPSMWVAARQYTGRIVTITNDNIFKQPVYNYTANFHSSGKKCVCPFLTMRTARPPRRSSSMPRAGIRPISPLLTTPLWSISRNATSSSARNCNLAYSSA